MRFICSATATLNEMASSALPANRWLADLDSFENLYLLTPVIRRVWRQSHIIGNVRYLYYNCLMPRIRFVFLTASPFSGSTLFSFLVNSHPDIATVGEMSGPTSRQDPETYQCSCGKGMKDCHFWIAVKARMGLEGLPFDPGRFDTRISLGSGYR
jgi:hypothetical protein